MPHKRRKSANSEDGTAWLKCPKALFPSEQSNNSTDQSGSKLKDKSNEQGKNCSKENASSTKNATNRKSDKTNEEGNGENLTDNNRDNGSTSEMATDEKLDKTKKQDNDSSVAERKKDKSKDDKKQYLVIIEEIVKRFRDENNSFAVLMQHILKITKNKKKESMQYNLIKEILESLSDSTIEEISDTQAKISAILIPRHMKHLYVADSSFSLYHWLGRGGSGNVFVGSFTKDGKTRIAALKSPLNITFNTMIENEARMMSQLDHENIIKILAVNKDTPMIAIELMELGNFREAAERMVFSIGDIIKVFKDVASGMEYLHSHDFLHRDLSSRNVFFGADRKCKIGDFGTCVYVGNTQGIYKEEGKQLDGHNVSPESTETRMFSKENDVWAMGTLIFEVFHYHNGTDPIDSLIFVLSAFQCGMIHLPRPDQCPDSIFIYCKHYLLNRSPSQRPNFTTIKKRIQEVLDKKQY